MSAKALDKKIVVNEAGDPVEVIIPYDQYVNFIETYGLDMTEEEITDIKAAEADLEAGNMDAFVSIDEVRKELGLACTK